MVVTIYTTFVPKDKSSFELVMKRCPFKIDIIQVLPSTPQPIMEWIQEHGYETRERTMRADLFGAGAIFKIYESMIRQSDGVAVIGVPKSRLDLRIITYTMNKQKELWIAR